MNENEIEEKLKKLYELRGHNDALKEILEYLSSMPKSLSGIETILLVSQKLQSLSDVQDIKLRTLENN